jgi:hypothetical protein
MRKPTHRQAEPGTWNQHDLLRRLCHALDIAKLTVDHLAANGYTDALDPSKNIRPEKIISETAVLLLAASSAISQKEVASRIHAIAERLMPHARSECAKIGLCLEPSVAWDYALPHVCLSRLGYGDPVFDELLRLSLQSQSHAGRERVPHRMLEQEWAAMGWAQSKCGVKHASRPAALRLARLSVLHRPMDLLASTRDDLYAFTHALMYVTDFNLNPAQLPRPRAVLLAEAEAMLAWCLDAQDYDLSGEVLLSWPITGRTWSPAAAFAFRVLAHVEDQAGFLPTPSTRVDEAKARTGVERTQYLLATAYHTVYVMGLLCAMSLQPGFAPPAIPPVSDKKPGSAKRILKFIEADGKPTHWRDEFDRLAAPQTDALAGFLLHIALRRKTASRDLGKLYDLLKVAHDLELADSPAASQAAELLERLAAYSRISANTQCLPSEAASGSHETLDVSSFVQCDNESRRATV